MANTSRSCSKKPWPRWSSNAAALTSTLPSGAADTAGEFSTRSDLQAGWSRSIAAIDGVLLDLGISSPQIDDPARGFSLRADGPLDMRMDPSRGESAAQWLAHATVAELKGVIADYGEERFAQQIARAIVAARAHEPVVRTRQLAAIVAKAISARARGDWSQDPATRTFQAIRIFVN